ncbi:MAG: hypothetical protein U5J82_12630 [Desulfobacterales bacterium]|nr:hypothetical protein [Desulfobacterales bacterium]
MAKKIEFDAKRLLKMVKDGVAQSEIMKKFKFNTSTQLKVAYTNAFVSGVIKLHQPWRFENV